MKPVETHQPLVQFISQEMGLFMQKIQGRQTVSLSLNQLALLAATLPADIPTLAFSAYQPKKFNQLHHTINGWNTTLNTHCTWHAIEQLSDQEKDGVIITPTSRAFHHLLSGLSPDHNFLITPSALESDIPDPVAYQESSLTLTVGETRGMKTLVETMVTIGYTRGRQSVEPGTFTVTGEVIKISHPLYSGVFSLTFNGPAIERIIHIEDRRSHDITSLTVPPMKFPAASTGWQNLAAACRVITSHTTEITGKQTIIYDALAPTLEFPFHTVSELTEEAAQKPTLFFYENFDHAQQLAKTHKLSQAILASNPLGAEPILLTHPSLLILSEKKLTPETKQVSPITQERALELIGELRVGKPAVHADHGIGIFEGIETRLLNGEAREYLVMRYAEGDALSVPVEYAHKVTPYLGEKTPAIHRLHGSSWTKVKQKAKHDAVAFAKDLLSTARERNAGERTPYSIQPHIEEELHASFPHTLTEDQARTWEELKQDLAGTTPVDRVIIGDVGFGKTEMALRAAYHAMANGKQVALLAPTTLLVQQHFDTFTARLPKLAGKVGMLSRFTSAAQQKQTRAGLAEGSLQICIGTHALLAASTEWKNLGLVIIDEEQRFGVKQKEHFKKIRATADVISLSATPIPRTLSMALSGLRQLSLITTAPKERKDIVTTVARVSDDLLKKAISQELSRDGQCYVVAPKIRHLASIREHIAALFPKAIVTVAHGQMPDETLSHIIHEFDQGKIDILVSSSIVENGLDLPNANTMIVWHAPQFGLSDLYQLRGRIGRREKQGYGYFLFDQHELTLIQKERLAALTEASRLGSGWLIAQRDLEIRGAGNLLGAEQSGAINAVGVQLYLDLVQQAVSAEELTDVTIELPFPALLPAHYIADTATRTRWYIRLNRASEQALADRIQTLEESFGTLPPEGENLIRSIKLQKIGSRLGIKKISSSVISPPDEDPYERLEIVCNKLPHILEAINTLGNWNIKNNQATLGVNKITPELIDKLIVALKK